MKRSTVALVTVGMILGGAGVVEILETGTASSAPVDDRTVSVVAPARVSDSVITDSAAANEHLYTRGPGTPATGP